MDVKFDFSGETVLVTGGSRGTGAVVATSFAKAGANVLITFRREGRKAKKMSNITVMLE
ncbi:MAG: SDR family NAD(P)-dependent oxidoreductase [Magnetococcales bacterium]|nr:SDR family NAD(P)-dependent oxidoreductase [Magnetococcales bacterium]